MAGKKSLKKAEKYIKEASQKATGYLKQGEAKAVPALQQAQTSATGALTQGQDTANQAINQGVTQGTEAINTAAGQQIGALQQGTNQAIGSLNQAQNLYSPLAQAANEGFNAYGSALGLGGADAASQYQASPGYQWQLEQGLQALDRQAGARGNPYNATDVMKYSQGLANQDYQNYINNLQPYLSVAPNIAGAQTGIYTNQANLYGQQGANQANVYGQQGQNLANIYGTGGTQLANVATGTGQGLSNVYTGTGSNLSNVYTGTGQNLANANIQGAQLMNTNAGMQSNQGLQYQQLQQQQQQANAGTNPWNVILGLAGPAATVGAAALKGPSLL